MREKLPERRKKRTIMRKRVKEDQNEYKQLNKLKKNRNKEENEKGNEFKEK